MEIRQSGVLPYRPADGKVLLVTSRRTGRWIIPKGMLEPDMTPAESAAREALEEAGVRGVVESAPLGEYSYEKYERSYQVVVFLMRVNEILDDWQESDERQRKWFAREDAAAAVKQRGLRDVIEGWVGWNFTL